MNIFISYDRRDADLAMEVCEFVRDCNCNPVIDYDQNLPGDRWRKNMLEQLENANAIILLLTVNSLSSKGTVQEEIRSALRLAAEDSTVLIPLLIDPVQLPADIRSYQTEVWNGIGKANLRRKFIKMKDEIDVGLLTLRGLALASAGLIYWMKKKKKKKP